MLIRFIHSNRFTAILPAHTRLPVEKPQGIYEMQVCPKGFYCPTFRQKLICPKGNYCPTGTVTPVPCSSLSSCPEGSAKHKDYTGIVFCVGLDLVLLFAYLIYRFREYKKAKESLIIAQREREGSTTSFELEAGSMKRSGSSEKDNKDRIDTKLLVSSYKKALSGRRAGMTFKFDNLGLTLKNGKTILSGVTGTIQQGSLTAVMGPSGAGKSTFLSILMGKTNRTHGTLLINDAEAEIHQFKNLIGFVPQDDIMLRELTVRENVLHSARIRLPSSWSKSDINEYVDRVLESLSLSHVANTLIGDETQRGVSGGQRKRVNIGMELAAVPQVIFLDEPTSGLDATGALKIMKVLRSLTKLNVSIISVIHQPRYEIFKSFDDVLLIAPGGKTAYHGPTQEVIRYFENLGFIFSATANPSDILMDILSGKGRTTDNREYTSDDLVVSWENHKSSSGSPLLKPTDTKNRSLSPGPAYSEDGSDIYSDYSSNSRGSRGRRKNSTVPLNVLVQMGALRGASFFKQIYFIAARSIIQQFRFFMSLIMEVGVAGLCGAVTGIAVRDYDGELYQGLLIAPYTAISPAPIEWAVPNFGLLICCTVGIAGAPAGVKVFGEERPVYWRETSSGQNRLAYFLGKIMSVIYRYTLSSLHFTALFTFFGTPIFFNIYGMGSLISMLTRRENASLVAVVMGLVFAAFCGYAVTLVVAERSGIRWLLDLSFTRWGTEALYTSFLEPYEGLYEIDRVSAPLWGYTLRRYTTDILVMLALGLGFNVLAYSSMVMLHRDKQR
ncbi:P-loop containing nucleoside triphosphate hydrolase protein [Paraphysoderma sedebokerense]|nr:P-loop containing nucleoside triphosphate hydrolase protein [Paraphysoderma sedebokerense]